MGWKSETARWVSEARAILSANGYPTQWAELRAEQPPTPQLALAVRVVAAVELLAIEVERGRTERALDRYHAAAVAFEEMDILARHPELNQTRVTTSRLHKNLRTGILRNQGGDKGRERRSSGVTSQKLKTAIDEERIKCPKRGITAIRDTVGERFGITGRYVCKLTNSYNPKKV